MEKKDITSHLARRLIWCLLVEVMISILISLEWGKLPKCKVQRVNKFSGLCQTPPPLLRAQFCTVCCNTVDHMQSSGGRPQKLVRVFDGLWHLLRHGSCLWWLCGWASCAPSERMKTFRPMWECPGPFPGRSCTTELSKSDKKHYPTSAGSVPYLPSPSHGSNPSL